MATQTINLNLNKVGATDPMTPNAFDENFDIIDAQIADLNRYKATIDAMNITVGQIQADIASLGTLLDELNGEEV